MKINKAEFVKSFASFSDYNNYKGGQEICVVGRSNVGKSSFINALINVKLAKTSSLPGRTRLINVFKINDGQFFLVDLPGYGYAKTSKSEKNKWGRLIEDYLTGSANLRHIYMLVDIRHKPTKLDIIMIDYLNSFRLPFTVIATKSDKLSTSQIIKSCQTIASDLALGKDNIIPVSSSDKKNIDKVINNIGNIIMSDSIT